MATASELNKDDILIFTGYTDPNLPVEDQLLVIGQRLKVWEIDTSGAIAVLPGLEDGTFDEQNGDTVYDGEYMTLAEHEAEQAGPAEGDTAEAAEAAAPSEAAQPAKKTAAKKSTKAIKPAAETTAPAAKAAPAKKTAAKGKAKTTEAAPAETAPAEEAAPAAETGKATTIQPVNSVTVVHSSSVQALLGEYDALDAAQYLVERQAENDYTLGGVLAEIKREGIYQRLGYDGKKGFEEYIENSLGIHYRKAMYLIQIYEHFRQLEIPEERLAEIGWSKAKELTNITDRAKFDELYEFAKDNTRDALIEHIRSTVNAGDGSGGGTTTATKITRNFKLFEDQATTVDRAIAAAKTQAGSDDDNAALEHICAEWSIMQEGNQFSLEETLALVEARFNVSLQIAPAQAGVDAGEGTVDEDDVLENQA